MFTNLGDLRQFKDLRPFWEQQVYYGKSCAVA